MRENEDNTSSLQPSSNNSVIHKADKSDHASLNWDNYVSDTLFLEQEAKSDQYRRPLKSLDVYDLHIYLILQVLVLFPSRKTTLNMDTKQILMMA